MIQLSCLGEPLIELCPTQTDSYCLGVAGDVLNTAAALSSLGIKCQLVTALSNSELSDRICQFAQSYGISTAGIPRLEGKQPGLYMISNDEAGERYFSYWRDNSPAKIVFSDPVKLQSLIDSITTPWLYLSGISLALFSDESAAIFFSWCEAYVGHGNKIIYDNNYRPLLWQSRTQAQQRNEIMLKYCELFLPSLEDQAALLDISDTQALLELKQLKINEIVIKQGINPLVVVDHGVVSEFPVTSVDAIDTTGAGDGFNGGYLAARLQNKPIAEAAQLAMLLSTLTVQQKGAILPPEKINHLF
ncbi:MAG: 2-dehydro-3-deoxygluconokinase [Pseudomonadales bacterium]|jgi:2-dehydro-3-deoxygluconokinase